MTQWNEWPMTKKIVALADYISAHDAAQVLSLKMGRPVQPKYIRTLAKSKRQPVRVARFSNRLLYLRADIEKCIVKQKYPSTFDERAPIA